MNKFTKYLIAIVVLLLILFFAIQYYLKSKIESEIHRATTQIKKDHPIVKSIDYRLDIGFFAAFSQRAILQNVKIKLDGLAEPVVMKSVTVSDLSIADNRLKHVKLYVDDLKASPVVQLSLSMLGMSPDLDTVAEQKLMRNINNVIDSLYYDIGLEFDAKTARLNVSSRLDSTMIPSLIATSDVRYSHVNLPDSLKDFKALKAMWLQMHLVSAHSRFSLKNLSLESLIKLMGGANESRPYFADHRYDIHGRFDYDNDNLSYDFHVSDNNKEIVLLSAAVNQLKLSDLSFAELMSEKGLKQALAKATFKEQDRVDMTIPLGAEIASWLKSMGFEIESKIHIRFLFDLDNQLMDQQFAFTSSKGDSLSVAATIADKTSGSDYAQMIFNAIQLTKALLNGSKDEAALLMKSENLQQQFSANYVLRKVEVSLINKGFIDNMLDYAAKKQGKTKADLVRNIEQVLSLLPVYIHSHLRSSFNEDVHQFLKKPETLSIRIAPEPMSLSELSEHFTALSEKIDVQNKDLVEASQKAKQRYQANSIEIQKQYDDAISVVEHNKALNQVEKTRQLADYKKQYEQKKSQLDIDLQRELKDIESKQDMKISDALSRLVQLLKLSIQLNGVEIIKSVVPEKLS
ncbi:MAG: hypothetical protein ACO2ZM_02930 [Francisellaceae bacterium]